MFNGQPLNLTANYSYASYWYATSPTTINTVAATNIQVLKDEQGQVLDGTEIVVRYLQSLPNQTVTPELNRIHLLRPLPVPVFGNPEIQPLRGATP